MAVSAREPIEATPDRVAAPVPRKGRRSRVLVDSAIIIVLVLLLAALVRAFAFQAFHVPSSSMEPTLIPSDRIIASKMSTRVGGVQRGEILVFEDAGGWVPEDAPAQSGITGSLRAALTFVGLLPSDSGHDLVKRVIGLSGDRVACCDSAGRIVLNGVSLEESYVDGPTDQVRFDVTVPEGMMFVMGDNRGNSRDSRYHLDIDNGGVPLGNAVGRVVMTIWPSSRIGLEPIPSIFDAPAIGR